MVAQPDAEPEPRGAGAGRRMTGHAERSAAVSGGEMRVWEKGTGPAICFFAGLAGLPRWLPVLDRLAESHRVSAPSLPGAPGGHSADSLDEHVDWLLAARDAHRASETEGGALVRRLDRRRARRRRRGLVAGSGRPAGADRSLRHVRRGRAHRRRVRPASQRPLAPAHQPARGFRGLHRLRHRRRGPDARMGPHDPARQQPRRRGCCGRSAIPGSQPASAVSPARRSCSGAKTTG